ncbi:MAG: amino acid ABC transporter substrate-binding protein [Cyanobacteriota bacterium]|nr:amino acid ABC transporter substrate-binding protein [Cyanobacteriota bacterium]
MAPSQAAPLSGSSLAADSIASGSWRQRFFKAPWRSWLMIFASLLGCQTVSASGLLSPSVVVLLPKGSAVEGANEIFLKGFQLGEEKVRGCGLSLASVKLRLLNLDDDPAVALSGNPRLKLVVAPPAADLRAFSALASKRNLSVVLPYQRGASLRSLGELDARSRLWFLVAPVRDDHQAMAQRVMEQGWRRVMVVRDPSELGVTSAKSFTEAFEILGGRVESYEPELVQSVSPDDGERLKRLQQDLVWLGPDALVLASRPSGPLAQALKKAQMDGSLGRGPQHPAWVWLASSDLASDIGPEAWEQLLLKQSSRGPGWQKFSESFEQHWGQAPDLLAAAGFDTARIIALSTMSASLASAEGSADPLGWVDAESEPQPLCKALRLRLEGKQVRLEGAASSFALRAGQTPSGTTVFTRVSALGPG